MPTSRKRQGHHPHHHSAAIPARQRTKGRIIWALLAAVFGLLIGFFGSTDGYVAPLLGCLLGAVLGYFIGKNLEKSV